MKCNKCGVTKAKITKEKIKCAKGKRHNYAKKKPSKADTIKKKPTKERKNLKKKLFIEALYENAGNIKSTCEETGVGRTTYYEWMNPEHSNYDPDFVEKVKRVDADLVNLAESQLMRNIQRGKETSLIFFLKNKKPDKWNEKRVLEIDGQLGVGFRDTAESQEDLLNEIRKKRNALRGDKQRNKKSDEKGN